MGTRMLALKRQDSRLTHHKTPNRPAIYTNTHSCKKVDFKREKSKDSNSLISKPLLFYTKV